MTLNELITAAKDKAGTLGAIADQLGIPQSRISEWKRGAFKPNASMIIQLAEIAGVPPVTTLAEVEKELHPEAKAVWERVLGNMRAAGVTASVTMLAGSALMTAHNLYSGLYIMSNRQSLKLCR